MEKLEKIYVWLAVGILLAFIVALIYASVILAVRVPTDVGQIVPNPGEALASATMRTPPFDQPGVQEVAPGKYKVVVLGQAWMFNPPSIELPLGADVTFYGTSLDIDHGFFIPNTDVNMMLLPGQVSILRHKFDKAGVYRIICHEYCGTLHHLMTGTITVK
ncbi:cytochrome C oxidase subunit II [Methylacidiphilum kamchatkense Kam1]|uniref:Cytochrome C oxidase subunit II n=1 Tax=Methylacidiphilum kamchatkense Kam1 TaxID=1202785 RepID=A0A0C1V3P2_9BACT|nr:cytochrome c oxidase subunit II [Methylacidiphilum kamchatkense]KIE58300.1 cytochrome C oxidase subunit II [Methylacidiphilum kamchatkense Kam1]QDQ42301.1 cytochrome c oxidase subunit 2 [Methylacidiphilum kamchatkense Kam1]